MKRILSKINEKSKSIAKYFFIETKLGIWIMSALALFNSIEGIVHLITAIVGMWGGIDTNVTDIRVWFPIAENFLTGILSLITAWALGIKNHHHH